MCKLTLYQFDVTFVANGMISIDTMLFLTLVSYLMLCPIIKIELMRWYLCRYAVNRSRPAEVEEADMEARVV